MRPLTEAQETILKNLVYERGMFVGRDRLYKYMRRNNIPDHPTKRQVEHWLSKQEWHQRFHPPRKRKNTRPILSNRAEAIYQVDLCDMISYRERRYQYIICAIDIFSKKAYTRALRDKRTETVANSMREIIETNDLIPQTIVTDHGGEFVGAEFEQMLTDLGIRHHTSNPHTPQQNSIVERFNGTLKRSLYQQMHAKGTRRWVDQLPILTSNYNNLYHRSIRMSPNEAADYGRRVQVAATLRQNHAGKYIDTPVMFALGDRVRLRNIRKKYDKSSVPTFGADVFQIVDVIQPGPDAIGITSYKIAKETEDGGLQEALHGRYNDSSLLRIIDVQEYAPPGPYVDSEDDEFPDDYPDPDEPVQRRRIDQRELDELRVRPPRNARRAE